MGYNDYIHNNDFLIETNDNDTDTAFSSAGISDIHSNLILKRLNKSNDMIEFNHKNKKPQDNNDSNKINKNEDILNGENDDNQNSYQDKQANHSIEEKKKKKKKNKIKNVLPIRQNVNVLSAVNTVNNNPNSTDNLYFTKKNSNLYKIPSSEDKNYMSNNYNNYDSYKKASYKYSDRYSLEKDQDYYQSKSNYYNSSKPKFSNKYSNSSNSIQKNEDLFYDRQRTDDFKDGYTNTNSTDLVNSKSENLNENINYFNDYNNDCYKNGYYSSYRNNCIGQNRSYKSDFSHIKTNNGSYRVQPSNYNNPNFKILDKIDSNIYPFTYYYRLHNDILDYSNDVLERIQNIKEIKLFTISHLEKIIKNSLGKRLVI